MKVLRYKNQNETSAYFVGKSPKIKIPSIMPRGFCLNQ